MQMSENWKKYSPTRAVFIVLTAALLAGSAEAPSPAAAPGPVDDAALITRAKADGQLSIYGAGPANLIDAKAKRFEAAYGIKVTWQRLGGSAIPARVAIEQRGGVSGADVLIGVSGLATEQMKRSGFYAQYRPPEARSLLPGTFDPDGYWFAHQIYTETICYNPVKVKALGLKPPRSWEDLASKDWRGQFALFKDSWEWYAALKSFLGAGRAGDLMRSYAANNPSIQGSHQIGVDLTIAGEVLAGANVFGYTCLLAKAKGSPIELVNPTPTVIELGTIGILKTASHPAAARLFERWMLSKTVEQWTVDDLGETVARKDVKNDPRLLNAKVRYVISNMSDIDAINADIKTYNQIFNFQN